MRVVYITVYLAEKRLNKSGFRAQTMTWAEMKTDEVKLKSNTRIFFFFSAGIRLLLGLPRCPEMIPSGPCFRYRCNNRLKCRGVIPIRLAPLRWVIHFSSAIRNISLRFISSVLIVSVLFVVMSYLPPKGHFNFAQIGHYYFALTQGK
jgi:hypothetical protein